MFLANRCPTPQQPVNDIGGKKAFGNGSSIYVVVFLPEFSMDGGGVVTLCKLGVDGSDELGSSIDPPVSTVPNVVLVTPGCTMSDLIDASLWFWVTVEDKVVTFPLKFAAVEETLLSMM